MNIVILSIANTLLVYTDLLTENSTGKDELLKQVSQPILFGECSKIQVFFSQWLILDLNF